MNEQSFIEKLFKQNQERFSHFPDKEGVQQFVDELFHFLFMTDARKYSATGKIQKEYEALKNRFSGFIYDVVTDAKQVKKITAAFFEALPSIYEKLIRDAESIAQFDPAAESVEEVLLAYPGFYVIAVYRFSHHLWSLGVKIIPRLFAEYAHSKTGIDIHPGASIGNQFFIDHGTGIVIGETTIIGNNVKLYQGVTLGALNVNKELAKKKRHPTIEDNVIIYSGATILGGDTIVGHDSIIGGNVWLTSSVPSFSVVYHKSELSIRDNNPLPEAINFVI